MIVITQDKNGQIGELERKFYEIAVKTVEDKLKCGIHAHTKRLRIRDGIYKILKHLEASLDNEVLDMEPISAEQLRISYERWSTFLRMLQDEGYISGLVLTMTASDSHPQLVQPVRPSITLKGLEYLTENGMMQKAGRLLKGIKDLTIAGKGTQQIAEILEAEKVLNPTAVKDLRRGKTPRNEPCRWNNNTVRMILRHKEYAGYTVSFKTFSKSYKLKKRLPNNPENMLEIPDTRKPSYP